MAAEENTRKSESFGIGEIWYTYWFHDFILC